MDFDSSYLNFHGSESFVHPGVKIKEIDGKGVGLYTEVGICKDDIISITGGVIIKKDYWENFRKEFGDYAYYIEDNYLITPLNPLNPSADWRMNHCCEPNCGIRGQIVFVALRDIHPGEEVTFDYAMSEADSDYRISLSCGKPTCRGEFTGNDWMRPDLQQKYEGYFSMYIQRKIDQLNNLQQNKVKVVPPKGRKSFAIIQKNDYPGNGIDSWQ